MVSFFVFCVVLRNILHFIIRNVGDGFFGWKFALLVLAIFATIYAHFFDEVMGIFFAIPAFMIWWIVSVAGWVKIFEVKPIAAIGITGMIAIYLYLEGRVHEVLLKKYSHFKKFAPVYVGYSFLIVFGSIIFLLSRLISGGMVAVSHGELIFVSWQLTASWMFFLSMIIAVMIFLGLKTGLKNKTRIGEFKLAGVAILVIIFAILPFI